jgi:hypothetical protein
MQGVRAGIEKLVDFEGDTSNSLFEILAEWESYLKAENIDIHIGRDCEPDTARKQEPVDDDHRLPKRQTANKPRPGLHLRGPSR